MEIRIVGHMAADGGAVAEEFVFDRRLARANRVEEICQMTHHIAVAGGREVRFLLLVNREPAGRQGRIFLFPT